jgi:hypothetical protein
MPGQALKNCLNLNAATGQVHHIYVKTNEMLIGLFFVFCIVSTIIGVPKNPYLKKSSVAVIDFAV